MNELATTKPLPFSNRRTHGMTGKPEYVCWVKMIARCTNPNENNFSRYGAVGISVCDEWRNSFEVFLADMGKRPTLNHSIERKNNELGYSKENCRWATRIEQGANKRNNLSITFQGQVKILAEWCRELGLNYDITRQRMTRDGWTAEKALSTGTTNP